VDLLGWISKCWHAKIWGCQFFLKQNRLGMFRIALDQVGYFFSLQPNDAGARAISNANSDQFFH